MKPFLQAARPVLVDSLGVMLFAILIALHVDLPVAVAAGASTAIAVVLWHLLTRRPAGTLQWMSLSLVCISGGASLWFHDPRFVMAKPSVLYAAVGLAMLRPGWLHRYIPASVLPNVERSGFPDLLTGFGYVWSGLMFLTAAANLAIALAVPAWWPAFIAVFPLASKAALFLAQFGIIRRRARSRLARLPSGEAEA